MNPEMVADLIGQTLYTAFLLSAPLLLIGFAVGIAVNLFQVATSLQDSSVSTIPRLASFFVGLVVLMPWMLKRMITFTITLLGDLSRYAQ